MTKLETYEGGVLDTYSIEYRIPPGACDIAIGIDAEYTGTYHRRGTLISFAFTDVEGNKALPDNHFSWSAVVGEFFYLSFEMEAQELNQYTVKMLSVPPGATALTLRGKHWQSDMQAQVHELYIVSLDDAGLDVQASPELPRWLTQKIPAKYQKALSRRSQDRAPIEPGSNTHQRRWAVTKEILAKPRAIEANRDSYRAHGHKPADQFKVALICDEFTFNSFSPEFNYAVLEPDGWRETIERLQPDILFCESAWSGVDNHRRPWRGQIYRSVKFKYENRNKLLEILAYCKQHSIPTVFWNKEDPTHFFDRVNDFVDTASRFDYVLTTAEEMVDEYSKFMPADRVGVMQFAAQPRYFNPMGNGARSERAIFAGAWYDVHPQRCAIMQQGLDWAISSGLELQIYDRNLRSSLQETSFPEPYSQHVKPAVSHRNTARLYRESTVGLNFNTVTNSNTMFARRVFELAASGTMVASNYSPVVEKIYGDDVVFFDKTGNGADQLSNDAIAERAESGLRKTLMAHTYRHRFEELLNHLNLQHQSSKPAPTMMVLISSNQEADIAVQAFRNRSNEYSRLLLVVDRSVPSSLASRFFIDYSSTRVDVVSAELIATEGTPTTNFMFTPDAILTDPGNIMSDHELKTVLMHTEYTRHPVRINKFGHYGMRAAAVTTSTRIAAVDVATTILNPSTVRPILEVAPCR